MTIDTWAVVVKKKPTGKFKDTKFAFTVEKQCDDKIVELNNLHKSKGYVYTKSFRRIHKSIDILLDESKNKFERIKDLSLKIDKTIEPNSRNLLFKTMNTLTKSYDKFNGHV